MKTFKLLFLIVTLAGLLAGCAKDEIVPDQNSDLMLKKALVAPVFVVEPNGTDDTENLKNAFADAQVAGPGSVVQLIEGEYHLGFLQIRDFDGCFKGAGKDKTIITAMNNLDGQALLDQGLEVDLIKFVGGDVRVSDFTIQTPSGKVCATGPVQGIIRCLINFSANNAVYEPFNEERCINVVVDNVHSKGQVMEGGIGYNMGHNCYLGLAAGWDNRIDVDIPRERINFKITNSEIETFVYGLVLQAMKESKLIVGEKNKGNLFHSNDQAGGIWEFRNTEVLLEGNTFMIPASSWGIDLDNSFWYPALQKEPQTEASIFVVQNNVFEMEHARYSMLFHDFRRASNPEEMPVLFLSKNNQFIFTDGYSKGIICRRTKDAVIRNNKFSGYGILGVQVDSPGSYVYNENGLLLGNNFSNFEYTKSSVTLTADTRNWTIVGGDLGETVINNSENNLISGFNNNTSDVPFGQTIVDNLEEIRGPLHDLNGQ